jgi:hypothetical protein
MNAKVINTIGVGIAVLVVGWAWYAVLTTFPPAPSAAPVAPAPSTQLSGPMATIAAHQAATNAMLNPPDPSLSPAPPDSTLPPIVNPNESSPGQPGTPGATPTALPTTTRPLQVEKWDFDFEKKPLPPDVK